LAVSPDEVTTEQQPGFVGRVFHLRLPLWSVLTACTMLAVSVLAVIILPHDRTTPARSVFLGSADIQRYCRALDYSGASLDGDTAYDWHCKRAGGSVDSLSVIEVCRWQYGHSTAQARYGAIRDPASWQCWDHVIVLGRVDLNEYCRSTGYSKALLEGLTVDGWHCVSTNGDRAPIDPDGACRWRYGSRALVANVAHFRAPWEHWDCWG
jgi:hypothetical protein